jgi:hypothetical protein
MTLENKLSGKNIIFFSVQTFNLEREIKNKLEELGAKVRYYDERPSNNNFTKGIIRLKRSLYQTKIDNYYKAILADTKNDKFDFLFVNRGEVVPTFFLIEFRKLHVECEFIFYTWDSFTNHTHPTTILEYFDRRLTFDPEDATKFNINFRPLFYLDAFESLHTGEIENDILFLGTAHSDRYRISSEIKNWALGHQLTMFCYYYMHGRFVYLYKRLFDQTFKQFDYSKLSFTSLKLADILALYKKSNVVLDINHPHQKGLTMRTFEAIGAKKKIITTNKEIVKFPFYNANNIEIIERDNICLNDTFFKNDYQPIESNLYRKLSLEGWLYNIFVDSETSFWDQCK